MRRNSAKTATTVGAAHMAGKHVGIRWRVNYHRSERGRLGYEASRFKLIRVLQLSR